MFSNCHIRQSPSMVCLVNDGYTKNTPMEMYLEPIVESISEIRTSGRCRTNNNRKNMCTVSSTPPTSGIPPDTEIYRHVNLIKKRTSKACSVPKRPDQNNKGNVKLQGIVLSDEIMISSVAGCRCAPKDSNMVGGYPSRGNTPSTFTDSARPAAWIILYPRWAT